jgi:drug/metabolite transporter (DMT)-like permease
MSPRTPAALGPVALLGAAAIFPLGGVAVSLLRGDLPSAEVAFLWCATSCVVLYAFGRARGAPLRTRHPALLLLRGLAGAATVFFHFEALRRIPLAAATALFFSHPVWLVLVAFFLGKDRPRLLEIALVLVAVAGVVAVVDPVFGEPGIGELLALLAGACGATGTLLVRELRSRGESSATIAMAFFVVGAAAFALPALADARWPRASHLPALGLLVAAGTLGNLAYAFGYRFVRAPTGGVIQTTEVVFAFAWGAALLGQEPRPSTWVGGAAILAGAAALGFSANREKSAVAQAEA